MPIPGFMAGGVALDEHAMLDSSDLAKLSLSPQNGALLRVVAGIINFSLYRLVSY